MPEYICPKCFSTNIKRMQIERFRKRYYCKCADCGYLGEPEEFVNLLPNELAN